MNQFKKPPFLICLLFLMPLLFSIGYFLGLKKGSSPSAEEDQIYAKLNGKTYRGEAVWPQIKDDIRQLQKNIYQIKKQAIESLILEENIQPSTTNDDAAKYSEEELSKYLADRHIDMTKMTGKTKEDVLNSFKFFRSMVMQKNLQKTTLETLNIEWLIPMNYLDLPVKVGRGFLPKLASSSSNRSVVIFANYYCPYCKEAQNKIAALKSKYKDNINISFRFSMKEPESSIVFQSALAAGCAADQNKFAELHQAFFVKPPLNNQELSNAAEAIGINMPEFSSCMQSMKYKKDVLKDITEIEKLSPNNQTVAFVNGYLLQIQEPLEAFEAVLNQ